MGPLLLLALAACSDFFLGEEPNLVFPRDTAFSRCDCEGTDCPCTSLLDAAGGRWYLLSWPLALPWADARQFCQDHEGDLAVLSSSGEPPWVAAEVGERFALDDPWWLGLTDAEQEGTWLWIDGTAVGGDAPWGAGEPSADTDAMDCGALVLAPVPGWGDDDCGDPAYFICEGSL